MRPFDHPARIRLPCGPYPRDPWLAMHALVTGGAGFIGSHLCERLLAAGHRVTALDDLSTGRADNLAAIRGHDGFELKQGSIADPIALSDAVQGTDVIFHMAAAVGVKLVAEDPVLTIQTNIHPTEELLRMAVLGGQRIYIASTSEVYGKNPKEVWREDDDLVFGPTTKCRWAYGCSKAIDEFLALAYHQKYGLPVVIGRFFNVVGPRQVGSYGMVIPRLVEQALTGQPITVYDTGEQVRCFAHVSEIVDCVVDLTLSDDASGEIYNIGSDQPVSVQQLADAVAERVGDCTIRHIPYSDVYGAGFEDVQRRVPSVDKLHAALGRKPTTPIGDILDDVIAWKRAQLASA